MDWQLKLDPSNLLAVRLMEIKELTSDFLEKLSGVILCQFLKN